MIREAILEELKIFISESPKTIAEIAYNMGWEYSTTAQKLRVLIAGNILRKIETRGGSIKYTLLLDDV